MFMFFPFFYDWTIILVFIGLAISGAASAYMRSTFASMSEVNAKNGKSAAEVARIILNAGNLEKIRVEGIRGELTDHYSPNEKVLRLSDATKNSSSVAAIGVAAHEAGHALQDRDNYLPMKLRSSLVPITNFGQTAALPILMIGFLFGQTTGDFLITLGLILFSFTLLFQLVTLPVEFNASSRAMNVLEEKRVLTQEELPQARKVLRAAALTYVAGAIGSFLNLLRLFLIFGGGRRR